MFSLQQQSVLPFSSSELEDAGRAYRAEKTMHDCGQGCHERTPMHTMGLKAVSRSSALPLSGAFNASGAAILRLRAE